MMHFHVTRIWIFLFFFLSTKHTSFFINAGIIFFGKFKLLYALSHTLSNVFLSQKCGFASERLPVPAIRTPYSWLFLEHFSAALFLTYYLPCILSRALETVFKNLFKSQDTLESSYNSDHPFTFETKTWMS